MNEKPKKHTITYYDYSECQEYLQQKCGRDFRNYADHKYGIGDETPYQNFWHFATDFIGEFNKGAQWNMDDEWLEYDKLEDWQREIITMFLDEFGELDPNDGFRGPDCRIINFIADW